MTRQTVQLTAIAAIRRMLATCLGGSVLVAMIIGSAQAQTTRPSPLEDLQTRDGSDFFNGRGTGGTSSVMNFIQNAIIGTPRSTEEFSADQKENFDEATSLFRKRQAEQIRRQQMQSSPTLQVEPLPIAPMTNPPSN